MSGRGPSPEPLGPSSFGGLVRPGEAEIKTLPPSASPWRAYLDVRLNGGPTSRRVLTESHLVIGRVPGVQVLLDHHTVSRRHAEMFCDPFGRWWIRDLASTNGTTVNDEIVSERVLSPSDRVGIGDYTLTFHLDPPAGLSQRIGTLTLEDDKPTAIRTLLDFEPPRIAAEHLRTLLELSRRLLAIDRAEDRLGALCELMVRDDFHGTLALVVRIAEGGEPVPLSPPYRPAPPVRVEVPGHPPTVRPPDPNAHGKPAPTSPEPVPARRGPSIGGAPPYISRRVLSALRDTREPVLASNLVHGAKGATPMELTMSREVMELWVIACPLRTAEDEIDALYVTLPPDVGSVEWLSLIALAAQVYQHSEAAWTARQHAEAHAAIERELMTARQIQRALLPKRLDFTGLDVAVGFEPCKWVGGDYADVVAMPDGRVLCAVADVCGKGLQAALVTSSLYTVVRASLDVDRTLPALMERVNRHLCDWLPPHSFVTMVAVAIDPATGEIECVNAGHPPAVIVDRDGDLRYLEAGVNPALGVDAAKMESSRGLLEFGDVLAMYTDGLTELRNASKEMLGQERLGHGFARICAALPGEGSTEIAAALNKMLADYQEGELPEDDRAFLLAQRK
jgi:serine phosphatase RsbU (regulator of sigma subunit)